MTCSRIRRSLFIHAHEPLRGPQRLLVEYHLSHCPACRAQWGNWSHEGKQWRRALEEEPEPNGSAARLRSAVAARIRSKPAVNPRARVSRTAPGAGSHRRPRLALLLIAALLTIAINVLAAFGPSLAGGARRLWLHVTRRILFCDQVPKVNRTPPGGTESPGAPGKAEAPR